MQNIKYIVVAIILFMLFIVLQVNIFGNLPILVIIPNLFVIFSVYLAIFSNDKITPSILIILFGFIFDICFGNFIGLYSLLGFSIVAITTNFCNGFSVEHKIGMMSYVFIATFLSEIFLGLIHLFLTDMQFILSEFVTIVLITSIYNFILTLLIHPIFSGYIKEKNSSSNLLRRYR